MMKLALVLRLSCRAAKIPPRQLALQIGVSPSTLSRMLHGKATDGEILRKVLMWLMAEIPADDKAEQEVAP